MSRDTKYSIKNLQKDFPTDEACLAFIFDTLHSHKCSCGGEYRPVKGRKQFQCSKCRFQIAPASGTIFHKSDTPLTLWFHAIWIFSNAKSGISAKEMERQLGVTYKCAWRILSLIRKALKDENKDKLGGDVEIDTGFLGGRHYAGRNNEKLSESIAKKAVVNVAYERGGRIVAEIATDNSSESMRGFVEKYVSQNARMYTDSSRVYHQFNERDIEKVNHNKREFSRGTVHINTVETFFAHLKRSMRGTYKVLSKKHLQSYLDLFVWHYNNRHNDRERFAVLLGTVLHA